MLPGLSCPWAPQGNTPQTPADLLVPVSGLEPPSTRSCKPDLSPQPRFLCLQVPLIARPACSAAPLTPHLCSRRCRPDPGPSPARGSSSRSLHPAWPTSIHLQPSGQHSWVTALPAQALRGFPAPPPASPPPAAFQFHPGEFKVGFDPEAFNTWFRLPGCPFLPWSVGPALTPSPMQTGVGVGRAYPVLHFKATQRDQDPRVLSLGPARSYD